MIPPKKRNGPARALAKPETRQRVIPDKREPRKPKLPTGYEHDPEIDGHGSPWEND